MLASQAPLDLPFARIAEPQAEHLLAKILVKRPKERAPIEAILRHAYLVGGLDTQQVGGSFAMLHQSQQAFKTDLSKLKDGLAPGSTFGVGDSSFTASFTTGGTSFGRGGSSSMKRTGHDKHAKFA